jgi:hypothetical protein
MRRMMKLASAAALAVLAATTVPVAQALDNGLGQRTAGFPGASEMRIWHFFANSRVYLCVNSVCLCSAGRVPQMGWNSWNKFACNVSDTLIRETAKALITTGLAKKGYEYVNIDGQDTETWHMTGNATNLLCSDSPSVR